MSEVEKTVKDYIEFVQKTISDFSDIGDLIKNNEVSPQRLNYALAKYYNLSLSLNSEYQRQKISHSGLELDHQIWYDEKFQLAKRQVISEYENSRAIKPSVKEFETTLRTMFKEEWKEWELKIRESESKTQFFLRLRETLNKYDGILTTISNNMRSEMRSLSIDDRSNAVEKNSKDNRIRSRFPV